MLCHLCGALQLGVFRSNIHILKAFRVTLYNTVTSLIYLHL